MKTIFAAFLSAVLLLLNCKSPNKPENMKTTGRIERTDPALDMLIKPDAAIEVISEGYTWSEGPVWVASENMLLFSDVPQNKVYRWTESQGTEVYLDPSGYTGTTPTESKEPGANGLLIDSNGRLVLCQHGDRRVAVMTSEVNSPASVFSSLADNYHGKKLNSPNDVAMQSNGDFFFTDPPYGLPGRGVENDPQKELPFQGVYKIAGNGNVMLLTDSLTRPNGIALTPDEKTLIVANSDPEKAIWYAFNLDANDSITTARIFYDATENAKTEKGLPDGFKIDKQGNVFASGPGGVWVFDASGKVLGRIKLDDPCSNTALADDDKTLYITNNHQVLRVKLRD
jgi:gluconolactonase